MSELHNPPPGPLRLNLGGGDGPQPEGYVNVDRKFGGEVFPLDCRDASVDSIRASHVLEHFSHRQTFAVLQEWFRVLRPGGSIRIAVPDFDWICRQHLSGHRGTEGYLMGGHVDENDRHGAIFTENKLCALMRAAGFQRVRKWTSEIEDCAALPVSLNLEGFKPEPMATIQRTFELALQHYQAGQLTEAQNLCQQILGEQPENPDALHFLGLIAHHAGQNDIAAELIRRAVSRRFYWPEAHYNFANVLNATGDVDGAIASNRLAIAQRPDYPEAHNNLGNGLRGKGQVDQAIAAYRQAIALKPEYPGAYGNLGNALRAKGQLDEAVTAYRRAIALRPDYADAYANLGIALMDKGQHGEAITAFRQAVSLKPNMPEAHNNLGNSLSDTGQLDEAIAAYRQAIALRSSYPEAYSNLGVALKLKGQLEEAIAACGQAIALRPDFAEAHCHLGDVLREKSEPVEAVASYRRAIALKADYSEARCHLAAALSDQGQVDEAIAAYRQAIALKPDYPEAYANLGDALNRKGQLDEAIAACRHAIALRPSYPEAYNNLGAVLSDKDEVDEAAAAFHQAIALRPGYPEAFGNLGIVLSSKGQLDDAIAALRQAIDVKPDYADAHTGLAMILLRQGDFAQGWAEYEWRWKCKDFTSPARNFNQPQWSGEELNGRTILLYAEQGFGDTIQFIRYIPLVAGRGGRVVVEIPRELIRVVRQLPQVAQWVPRGEPLPAFDVHFPLLSLPLAFGTTLTTIPPQVPLRPEPELAQKWRHRLQRPPLKVALTWAGNPGFKGDRTRSMSLDRLAPLFEVRGAAFYSVQTGAAAEQARHPPAGVELVDLSPQLHDFADTAAVMSLMDLVITTDTGAAHLAGAMGVPVWLMLRFIPDWRWFMHRLDSPWYPAMRLFRQPARGDWGSVVAQAAAALSLRAAHRGNEG
jgi:tetratricopeptide (TPR) repeat protein